MKQIRDYTKAELQDAVNKSDNLSDVVRNLGFNASSGKKRDQVKKYCEQYGIDISNLIQRNHNPIIIEDNVEKRECVRCHRLLPITMFSVRNQKTGTLRADCKECHSKDVGQHYLARKNWLRDIKSNCGCAKCGDNRGYVLDFHHINPDEKDDTLARLAANASQARVEEELKKCIVLCANCHREFHHLEFENGLTIKEYLDLDKS